MDKTFHILVVDDSPDVEQLFSITFRRQVLEQEWRFFFAKDGQEALSILQEHPDIVVAVVDLAMPGIDGFRLLEAIHRTYPYIVSIVYSADNNRNSMSRAMRYGATDYLMKPVPIDVLKYALNHAVERYSTTNAATLHKVQQALEFQANLLKTVNAIRQSVHEAHHVATC